MIRKIFVGKENPGVKVSSQKYGCGSGEAVVERDEDVMKLTPLAPLTPGEDRLLQSPSSADPTASSFVVENSQLELD